MPDYLTEVFGAFEGAHYYEGNYEERLEHSTLDAAIEAVLELEPDKAFAFITAHKRNEVDVDEEAERVLVDLLERLDELFADPEAEDMTQPTEGMERAAKAFVAAVAAEYEVWMCDEVGSATVDVARWRSSRG